MASASDSSAVVPTNPYPSVTINNRVFRSKIDIIDYLESLPGEEQYSQQKIIGDKLLEMQFRLEDLIIDFYEYTDESKAYEKARLSRREFLEDNDVLVREVREIKAKRDVRAESLRRLTKCLTSSRGLALMETVRKDPTITGKSFITHLAAIFTKVTVQEGVAHLNRAILARNRRPRSRGLRPRVGITHADAKKAKQWIDAGEDWDEEDMSVEELRGLQLRFGPSGLLEEGMAMLEARPEFEDEMEDEDETRDDDAPARSREPEIPRSSATAETGHTSRPIPDPDNDDQSMPGVAPTTAADGDGTEPREQTATAQDPARPGTTRHDHRFPSPRLADPTTRLELALPSPPPSADPRWTKRALPGPGEPASTPTKKARVTIDADSDSTEVEESYSAYTRTPNTSECTCAMDAAWKNTVEGPDRRESFAQLRAKLGAALAADKPPCQWHVERLCGQLRLTTAGLSVATLMQRLQDIFTVSEGSQDWVRVISSNRTFPYFVDAPEVRATRDRHNLGVLKFAPVTATTDHVSKAECIPKTVTNAERESLETSNYGVVNGLYDWLMKDKTLMTIAIEEARMYKHHFRNQQRHQQDGLLKNMYYSLFQQLIRQDPATYEVHVSLRQDAETCLFAYPQCGRFFDANEIAKVAVYEGDTEQIQRGTSASLKDEIVLSEGLHPERTQVHPGIEVVRSYFQAKDEQREFIDLDTEAELTPRLDAQDWQRPELDKGALLCMGSGVPVKYDFTTSAARLSLASGLLARSPDDPELLENRVPIDHITRCHREMATPDRCRFERARDHIPGRFPPAVELSGLGPISDALLGKMAWHSPAVEEQKRLLLTGSAKEVRALYKDWRSRAKAELTRCWKMVQAREKKFYGNKSYFHHKADGAVIDLTADDEVFTDVADTKADMAEGKGKTVERAGC
ncbi:hypothetical protein BP5796_02309 [Coleophoma crateriformis]|uniref:Uncharacterized protein n=1 Tax=Coleophoma crateriformis TaxID=565419 RepID=A0A3D8SXZ4_9HELO|nr:hypothetical protein BP5796_02309 [Coleophoma crateriformis]